MDFFEKLIYDLVSLIAKMMDLVITVCKTLCGIPDASGNSQLLNLIQPSSKSGTVLIGIFCGFCIVTGLIATVVAMVESFNVKATDGFSPQKPYVDVLKGIMHMAAVAALFYIVVLIIGNLGILFEQGMALLGSGQSDTLGGRLLQNCFDVRVISENAKDLADWNALWETGKVPSWGDIKALSKGLTSSFNAWQSIISVFVVAMPLFGILSYMAKRLINIMLLFTVAPVAFSMYPLDDGHAKSEWYKDMKGALLGGVIMMVMLSLFMLISGVMFSPEKPLIPGDPVMNGIAQAFILGAGVSMLITITKTVLKYLGCDDALLANMKSMSPMRSLKAIGRGVKAVGAKAKGKYQSRRAGGRSPETEAEDKGSEREQLQRTTGRIATSRKANISRTRMDKSIGGGYAAPNDSKQASGTRAKITRYSSRDDYNKAPKVAHKQIEKSTAIPREKMVAKSGSIDNAKLKNTRGAADKATAKAETKKNTEVESFTKALDKFTKAILKHTKPTVKVDDKKQPVKIERKREIKKSITPSSSAVKSTNGGDNKNKSGLPSRAIKPVTNVNTNISTTTNVRPTISGVSNKAGDYGLKQSIKRNEQLLRQNMDKLKKLNSNIQAVPSKVTKNITSKKKQ